MRFHLWFASALFWAFSGTIAFGYTVEHVATQAALATLTLPYAIVTRDGVNAAGDAPPLTYTLTVGPCLLNAGTGDAAAQVPFSGGGKCWVANFPDNQGDVREWGAKCDGTTDDTAAINASFASGIKTIIRPAGKICYVNAAGGITIPGGVSFVGADFTPQPSPQTSGILCGSGVMICVTMGNNDNSAPQISNQAIFAQTPAAGTVGLWLKGIQYVNPHDIWAQGFAINYRFTAINGHGIYIFGTRLFSCSASDAHMEISGVPGVYISQSEFGCNNVADVHSNAYVRLVGDWDQTFGTVHFTDVQFNQGISSVVCAIKLANFTGAGVLGDLEIIGGHMETADNGLCSDSSVRGLTLFQMTGLWSHGGWGGTNKFFKLDPATTINTWTVSGNSFTGWSDITLAPASQINDLRMIGNSFLMPISITGAGNSTIDLTGNTYVGATIAGSFLGAIVYGVSQGGTYINSALGVVDSNLPDLRRHVQ